MKVKALAVALLLGLTPTAVFAQDATTPATPDAMAPAAITDFDTFLQGLSGADYTSAQNSIDTATTFNVVKLSTLANADAARLQSAMQPYEADIAGLSAKIAANANAKAAIDAAGVSADAVIWVETGADGAVTLYVNDLDMASSTSG